MCVMCSEIARHTDSYSTSAVETAENTTGDGLYEVSASVTRGRQLPTCLTDSSLPQLLPSPTYTSSQSQRLRHSLSDTGAQLITTPSSYRASFGRLQPVHMPDVDSCRQGDVISRATVSDTHRRFHFLFSSLKCGVGLSYLPYTVMFCLLNHDNLIS